MLSMLPLDNGKITGHVELASLLQGSGLCFSLDGQRLLEKRMQTHIHSMISKSLSVQNKT